MKLYAVMPYLLAVILGYLIAVIYAFSPLGGVR
jgi:hypothetical protein